MKAPILPDGPLSFTDYFKLTSSAAVGEPMGQSPTSSAAAGELNGQSPTSSAATSSPAP